MLFLLSLLACNPETEEPQEAPLPEVWGVAPAVDQDPTHNVVEYHLTASEVK